MTVHFFDVGQGDATLFQGDDFTILIDAGRHDRQDVVPLLQAAGVQEIDLFIGTHPHSDHIGQCDVVMHTFVVREVWLSGDMHTTKTFERCIDAILASDAGYHEPRAGEVFHIGSAHLEIVHPAEVTGDLNNGSIGVRFVFGDIAFMMTGDAEAPAERAILDRGHYVRASIIQLGHHGSRTSSTSAFLSAVQPHIAIYSAGVDNPYGHPHATVLDRLAARHIPVYGTDVHGTITVGTDGTDYVLSTQYVPGDTVTTKQNGSDDASGGESGPMDLLVGCVAGQVDLNTASTDQLMEIIHIGPVIAERIIQARPFSSLDDITRVQGIGDQRLQEIKLQDIACTSQP